MDNHDELWLKLRDPGTNRIRHDLHIVQGNGWSIEYFDHHYDEASGGDLGSSKRSPPDAPGTGLTLEAIAKGELPELTTVEGTLQQIHTQAIHKNESGPRGYNKVQTLAWWAGHLIYKFKGALGINRPS